MKFLARFFTCSPTLLNQLGCVTVPCDRMQEQRKQTVTNYSLELTLLASFVSPSGAVRFPLRSTLPVPLQLLLV